MPMEGGVSPLTVEPANVLPRDRVVSCRRCFGVHPKECPQVVAADKRFCQVWFPLTLFLNIIDDFMRVRGADITQVAV